MIIYTFQSFPLKALLDEYAKDLSILSNLKIDIAKLQKRIAEERPRFVVGIAATKSFSRFEPIAINKFNKGTILKGGDSELELFIPARPKLQIAASPTFTFCNWTMYHIQNAIITNSYSTKLVFIHLNPKDADTLKQILDSLED